MELEPRDCTLCGHAAPKSVKYPATFNAADLNPQIFSARRSPDRVHFRLVTCQTCGIVYSDPACAPDKLAALYEKSLVTYGQQEEEIYQSYAPVLDQALREVEARNVFAEIGGGRGFMLRYGVERSFKEQIEIEPSHDAQRNFRPAGPGARFICDMFGPDTLPESSVSLACFFQVLDHVPNPLQFVGNVYQALEPGGVALGVTHNTAALSAKVLRERSPIFDIEHTYLFNKKNAQRLFEKAGFTDVRVFDIANSYSAQHWLNLFPSPAPVRREALKVLQRVGLANVRIKLRAGNLAVIGKKGSGFFTEKKGSGFA